MEAAVDANKCFGCGLCVDICPVVFALNADNLAAAVVSPVPTAAEATCREAAENCPAEAISITE